MTRANRTVPRRRFNLTTTFYSLLEPAGSSDEIMKRHAGTREVLAPSWLDEWLEKVEPEFADRYAALRQLVEETAPATWERIDSLIQEVLKHLEDSPDTANASAQRGLSLRREKIAEALIQGTERLISIAKSTKLSVHDGHSTLLEQIEKRLGATDSLVIHFSDLEVSTSEDLSVSLDDPAVKESSAEDSRARSTTGFNAARAINSGLTDLGVRSLLFAARRGFDAYSKSPIAIQ